MGPQLSDNPRVKVRAETVRKGIEGTLRHVETSLLQDKIRRFAWVSALDSSAGRAGRVGGLRWWRRILSPDQRWRWRRRWRRKRSTLHTTTRHYKLSQYDKGSCNYGRIHLHGFARGEFRSGGRRQHPVWRPSLVGYRHGLGGDQHQPQLVRLDQLG